LLTDELLSRLAPFLDTIQISLDGASRAANDDVRGMGTFELGIKAIKASDRCAQTWPNVLTRISMTLCLTNASDIKSNFGKLRDMLSLQGRHEFIISCVTGRGRAKDNVGLCASSETMHEIHDDVIRSLGRTGLYAVPDPKARIAKTNCGFGESVCVGPDGQMYPCAIIDQRPIPVPEGGLAEAMRRIRHLAQTTDVDCISACSSCELRYVCGGPCRVAAQAQALDGLQEFICFDKSARARILIKRFETLEDVLVVAPTKEAANGEW
jgi:radical SAM protein with 4Fe4S-binding SPASM domain